MKKLGYIIVQLLLAAGTLSAGAPAAPSFIGDWEFIAVKDGKEDKNWPRTVMTVFADGSCVTIAPKEAGFEVVSGKWRQKGNDVWITDSGGEHRMRFDKSGRLKIVTDGKEQEFLRGYEFYLRRAKKTTSDAAQLEWEKLIKMVGCLVFGTKADAVECGIFLEKDWQAFLKTAKNDEQRFRFILSRFSSRKPTDIHICHIRNATEGEIAVFAAQRIVGANWYDYYEGHVEEFKKIIGTVADDYPLKRVLENTGACASLQRYFFRRYMTTLARRGDKFFKRKVPPAETPVRTPLDQAAAVAMAERHFVRAFGKEVLKERPWRVTDHGDCFLIKGTPLRRGERLEEARIVLRKSDGLICALILYDLNAHSAPEIDEYFKRKVPPAETSVRTPLDRVAAVAMAERHFVEVYGERVLKQRPWQVTDTGDAFFIKGTLRHGVRGGTATMWLRKSDGLILELIHYR